MMLKTLHVITGLGQGGAERQLSNLVSVFPKESAVFSINNPGVMVKDIMASGVPVYSGYASRSSSLRWIISLRKAIMDYQPDVIMGWMYHGNIAASITRFIGFSGPILWNVRHSVSDISKEKIGTRWAIRAGFFLKAFPGRIVYNSAAAAVLHEDLGYPNEKRLVLPNGFDLERFMPDSGVREKRRAELGVLTDQLLLGVVGRFHPMKNHLGWISALQMCLGNDQNFRCVMAGTGVADANGEIANAVREKGLGEIVTLLPSTSHPEKLFPALDLLVMPSSWGEGFPNVVGEAMACGVPALVTDVGDSAVVVSETGFVAEDGEPTTLANHLLEIISHGSAPLAEYGRLARQRMVRKYGLEAVAGDYRRLIEESLADWVK